MNKLSIASLFALAFLVSACGKEPATPTAAQQQPAPTVTPDPATTAEKTEAGAPPSAEEVPAPATVASISETDDETVDEAAATVKPSLRLGGPATSGSATSAKFKEGVNYTKLVPAQPTSVAPGKVEVVEVFWYACGHCNTLDPAIESWRAKGKPANVEFIRVPAMWNDTLRMHARIFYTAELLGKLEQLHTPIFREIHVKGNPLNTVETITAFFRENGVGTDEFQKAFSSFAVESKLQRADFLNRRYRIESVPTIIVHGKYKTAVDMAGGEQQLFQLIGELAASESGG